jgi:hypothetical protein
MKHLRELCAMSPLAAMQSLSAVLILGAYAAAPGQTVSLNDSSIVQARTNRIGINIGSVDYWDNGQILKNLIGSINPGFEPLINQQIWVLNAAGSTTTFTVPDTWDGVPPNYWAGGAFSVVSTQSGGAELGCTGTIASNTGPNYPVSGVTNWVAPAVTVSSPCSAAFSVGDIVIMSKSTFPTPESWWESSTGGFWGTVGGGGQLLSDTTDLCSTCGTQSLNMNAAVSGSYAAASWYFDTSANVDMFVQMNGTYQIAFWAKAASGSPALNISAQRSSTGGFNCGSYTPSLTSAWQQYTLTCTASESAGTTPGTAVVSFRTTGGSVYLDNVSFAKTSSAINNPTILRDEVVQTLQKFYGPSVNGTPGMFRYWLSQNAETLANWTEPDSAYAPTSPGPGYFEGPNGAGTVRLSLEDYLVLCQFLNAQPYLEVPVTFSTADAANLIEFLASPSGTTYGARRAALGQTAPWTSVFSTIHLSFCNECWNGSSFVGQSLPYRSGTPNAPNTNNPEYYYDYSMRAKPIFAAMRADSYYTPSSFDLVMNSQTAVNYTMDAAIQRAQPDSIEIEGYSYSNVNSYSPDSALWGPAMVEPYERVANPNDATNYYNSVHDYQSQSTCGASGTSPCNVNIYEWGQNTLSGSIDQTLMDYINAGAGEGVAMALQPLLNLQYYGITNQSQFALTGYQNGAVNGLTAKLWGDVIDMGGATNNVRPAFLAMSLVNQSIIGPMYSCPITGNATYNFAGSSSNGSPTMPALNNVPYLYAFCFENGAQRSVVLINTDLSNSHTVSFAGTNLPSGSVTEREYAPSQLDNLNEAPTGAATNMTPATVALYTSSLSSPSSLSLPPYSVIALDFTVSSLGTVATPTFSEAGGTYTGAQSVTLSDTTSGATIYYTTNGTAPSTSSTVYSAGTPISVSASETIEAIAVASGYNSSAVASAAYVINLPVAPGGLIANGTYTITNKNDGLVVDVPGGSTAPGTDIDQSASTGAASQRWQLTNLGNNYVELVNVNSGLALEVQGSSGANGASIDQSSYSRGASQIWQVVSEYGGLYALVNQYSGLALDVPGWSGSPGALLDQWSVNGGANQLWSLVSTVPNAASPVFSVAGGSYTGAQTVTLSDTTTGATIYYTANGTAPTTGSTLYSGAITVSASETIEAIAVASGYGNSTVATAVYTIAPVLPTPTFSPAAGTYTIAQSVTLSDAKAGTTIYYTTNGTTPSPSSTIYNVGTPISVSANETIEAIAVASGYTNSAVASAAYVINLPAAAMPTFSEGGGTYTGVQTIALSDTVPGATIYYTTNGTTPTTSSSVYSASNPIKVGSNETIEAIAVASGYTNSAVASAAYVINLPAAAMPTFSEGGGTYTGVQSITLSDTTPNATIFYTTNGTTPSASSTVYSAGTPISVSTSETIETMAVAPGFGGSAVTSAAYQIAVAASLIPNGTYSIVNRNSGQAMDVPGWSGAQGTALDQWSVNGGANQKWQLTNLGNNLVELVNANSGLAAEVNGSSTAAGAQIDQRQYVGTANQIWSVVSVGGGYYELVNQNSGMALDVPGWSGTPGTLLDQWNVNGGGNQVWSIH